MAPAIEDRWLVLLLGLTLAACGVEPGPDAGSSDGSSGSRGSTDDASSYVQLREVSSSPVRADRPALGTCELERDRSFGDRDDFGWVTMMRQIDSALVVTDYRLPPHLKVIDLSSGEVVHAVGRSGEGPGEFRVATSLVQVSEDPPVAGVYDYQTRRLTFVGFEGDGHRPAVTGSRRLRNGLGLFGVRPYRDGYVAAGLFADYTLARLDSAGRPVTRLVADPPFGPEDIGGSRRFAALMNNAKMASGGQGRYAVAYEEESIIDLIDLADGSYLRVRGPVQVETDYEIRDGRLDTAEGNERAYNLVTATEELVFAGFLGRDFETAKYGQKPVRVHVFDWQGRYLAELELEDGVTALGVSPDGSRLWGAYEDPFPRIGEWRLPPLAGPEASGDVSSSPRCAS